MTYEKSKNLKIVKRRPGRALALRDDFLVRQTRTRSGITEVHYEHDARRVGRLLEGSAESRGFGPNCAQFAGAG
jgi:hypothetical protein